MGPSITSGTSMYNTVKLDIAGGSNRFVRTGFLSEKFVVSEKKEGYMELVAIRAIFINLEPFWIMCSSYNRKHLAKY